MKVLQEQYNLIKEGKGNKAHFLKTAYRLFPDMLSPVNTFEDTVKILKNRSILSEGIGGVVTTGKTPDWHSIFKEKITEETKKVVNAKQNGDKSYTVEYSDGTTKVIYVSNDAWDDLNDKYGTANLKEAKEAKAEEKEPTKEVTDMETKGYDYKDKKNYDNVFGEEFLKGFYTEMGDSKNEGKTVEELRAIVAKNLAKDMNHYVKDGQFGVKGVGYQTEAPGLGTPKEAKGKFKSSGYGDLKENKDPKAETKFYNSLKIGDKAIYDGPEKNGFMKGDKVEVVRSSSSSTFQKTLTVKKGDKKLVVKGHGSLKPLNESSLSSLKEGELKKEGWFVKSNDDDTKYIVIHTSEVKNRSNRISDIYKDKKLAIKKADELNKKLREHGSLKESVLRAFISETIKEVLADALKPEDKEMFSIAVDVAEKLYDEEGSVKAALAKLPAEYASFKDELEQHLTQKFEG
jgi:hypothetical protein